MTYTQKKIARFLRLAIYPMKTNLSNNNQTMADRLPETINLITNL